MLAMNGLHLYEDMDWLDEVYGDLDLTMLHTGETHRVFVYGTLMKSMRNHHRLKRDGVRTISTDARTLHDDDFIMATRKTGNDYHAPVVYRGGPGHPKGFIFGEVYEVDNSILLDLDRFEGHPTVYKREKVMIWCRGTEGRRFEQQHPAWMYLGVEPPYTFEELGFERLRQGDGQASYEWHGVTER